MLRIEEIENGFVVVVTKGETERVIYYKNAEDLEKNIKSLLVN